MKKVALIHLAHNTTVTRMRHHKPVAKVIVTAACGAEPTCSAARTRQS